MFSSVIRPKGLRFDVVGQVLLAIFQGKLKSGDRLIVKRMAEDFGVSATPAREALLELAGLGVVELLPNKGAVVSPFGPRQLREIYSLRRLLEAEATRLACPHLPAEALLEIRSTTLSLIDQPDLPDWSDRSKEVDARFHALIAGHCDHNRLRSELEHYSKLVWATRSMLENSPRMQMLAHNQHLEIIEAALAGDAEEASQRMSRHIVSAGEVLIAEIKTRLEQEAETSTTEALVDTDVG